MIGRLGVATHAHTNTQVYSNPLGDSSSLTLGKLLCRSECSLHVDLNQFNNDGMHKLLFHPKWRGGPVRSALQVIPYSGLMNNATVYAAVVLEIKEVTKQYCTADFRRFIHLLVHIGARVGHMLR